MDAAVSSAPIVQPFQPSNSHNCLLGQDVGASLSPVPSSVSLLAKPSSNAISSPRVETFSTESKLIGAVLERFVENPEGLMPGLVLQPEGRPGDLIPSTPHQEETRLSPPCRTKLPLEMAESYSVEIADNQLLAFGRPVLTDIPDGVNAGPCAHQASLASSSGHQGVFLGMSFARAASRHVFSLGILRDRRFLGCFRFKLWWMTQRVGSCGREVPCETQFLLIECPPAHPAPIAMGTETWRSRTSPSPAEVVYVVVLPVLEGSFRSSLLGGFDDTLQVCVESGSPDVETSSALEAVYVHAGTNPFKVINEAVRVMEAHSGSFKRRELKELPGLLDHFGWCTWDAFYTDVTAEGVQQGLQSLADGGTPAKFLIIDDGWQTVSPASHMPGASGQHLYEGIITAGTQYASRLMDVKENSKFKSTSGGKTPSTFTVAAAAAVAAEDAAEAIPARGGVSSGPPVVGDAAIMAVDGAEEEAALHLAGLGELVRGVKATHAVKFVYVWHALLGYWGGVQPGDTMGRFEALLTYPVPSHGVLTNQPDMAEDTLTLNGLGVVHPGKAFHFYDELHSYLASCGVDGVKVDVQNILETLGAGHGGRVALAREFHGALEQSIRKNFRDNGIISCMSHNTDALYLAKQTAVVRASDDFWPSDPASQTVHIISVAYNSLFLGEFMQPDWDMFHSLHPAAEFHGAARAAGGCAVYISDKPGRHDFGVLRKLVFPDGTILRARLPGRPTRDCLFLDPARDTTSLLKIWNANACSGIVAAFNCQGAAWCRDGRKYRVHNSTPDSVSGSVSAADVDCLADVAPPGWNGDAVVFAHFADELRQLPAAASISVTLAFLQCEVYTVAPIQMLDGVHFAPVGLIRMYNSGGAVLRTEYSTSSGQEGTAAAPHGVNAIPTPLTEEQHPRLVGRLGLESVQCPPTAAAASDLDSLTHTPAQATATVSARGGGVFVAFASERPKLVAVQGLATDFQYEAADGRVSIDLPFSPDPRDITFTF